MANSTVEELPKVAHVQCQKRCAEIARRLDAEAIAGPHGHERIAGEVEEQVAPSIEVGGFRKTPIVCTRVPSMPTC